MKRVIGLMTIIAGVGLLLSSCSKKCSVPEGTTTGTMIVENAIVYPESGLAYGNMGGDWHIRPGHDYETKFEISLDGGKTRKKFEWVSGQYHILGNPKQAHCEVSFDKDVSLDAFANTVTYTVGVNDCESCEAVYTHENWILVDAVPAGMLVVYK